MPQNPEFSLNSDTLGVVYKDIGVLSGYASETAEQPDETMVIIGAYYEPDGEYKGLYFVLPEGEVKYFDVDVAKIGSNSDGAYITFEAETKNWIIRGLTEEDGIWISKCKTEIPASVLEQIVVGRSSVALSKYLGVQVPEPTPEYESVYAYYSENSPTVVALNYLSSYGTFTRLNYTWKQTDLSLDYYQDLSVVEIDPDKIQELVDKYDEADGVYSVKDVLKDSLDGGK